MVNSKDKGARYERYIADIFTQAGYAAHRSAQYCGNTGDAPDVVGTPYIHIECKSYKSTIWDWSWLRQAQRDSQGKNIPVVIHKINYGNDIATLDATDAYEMLIEYYTATDQAAMEKLTLTLKSKNKSQQTRLDGLKMYQTLEDIDRTDKIIDFTLDEFITVYREYEASRYLAEQA